MPILSSGKRFDELNHKGFIKLELKLGSLFPETEA